MKVARRQWLRVLASFLFLLTMTRLPLAYCDDHQKRNEEEKRKENEVAQRLVEVLYSRAAELYAEKNYLTSEMALKEALRVHKKVVLEKDFHYANAISLLGKIRLQRAEHSEAEALLREALQVRKEKLGELSKDYICSVEDLGVLYGRMGRYNRSSQMLTRVLEYYKENGEDDPFYLQAKFNFGLLLSKSGDLKKSEELISSCLKSIKILFGDDSLEYSDCLQSLGRLYANQGDYKRAESLLLNAYEIQKKSLKEHDLVHIRLFLAFVYAKLQRLVTAKKLLLEGSKYLEDANLGPQDYAISCQLIAVTYSSLESHLEAEKFFSRALQAYEKTKPPNYHLLAECLNHYALVLRKTERLKEARKLESRATHLKERFSKQEEEDALLPDAIP